MYYTLIIISKISFISSPKSKKVVGLCFTQPFNTRLMFLFIKKTTLHPNGKESFVNV